MPGPMSRWTPEQLAAIAADDPGGELYAATATLAAMTDECPKDIAPVTEADVLGALGVTAGGALLDAIEVHAGERVARLIRARGVDVRHPETTAMLGAMADAKVITAEQYRALVAMGIEQVPRWPGIRAADLLLARNEYAGG